nr:hypothetical protein [Campylobacterota bacterium]
MSRWITPFESHPFHSAWDNMQDAVKTIKINEISDENILTEIARLKKAIEYIDKYLKLIDPDINITNLAPNLNNFHQYINAVTNELNNFNSSHNVTYMHRANNNIDNCLNTLKVFHTLLPKVSGQGIYSMLKKYNETLEDALSEIDLTSAMEASKSIESLQQRLINGTEGEDSIQAQIEYMFQDTEEKHNELLEYYNTTLNDKKYDTTKEKIENAKDEIEKHTKEAHDKLIELSNKVDDLDKFYVKIFGTLNDEDERVGGLKNELE